MGPHDSIPESSRFVQAKHILFDAQLAAIKRELDACSCDSCVVCLWLVRFREDIHQSKKVWSQ
jgi:hypothetical protein